MKFVLFVEGPTEKSALPGFLKRWLDPKLSNPVGIRAVRFEGWNHYISEIKKKVELNLSGKTGTDVIAGIGLLDLYGPTFYPDTVTSADRRYSWGKQHIESIVGHPRFRQHFAVHETEAWLLCDPTILPQPIRTALPGSARLPETVNFDDPPSDLLNRLYKRSLNRPYKKVIDGSNLFQDLTPEIVYQRCPSLKLLLDEMLSLARAGNRR